MEKYRLYILLIRTNTFLSNLIHIIKGDTYTHAAIAFDKDLKEMYSFGRKKYYNPFIGCFRREDIHTGLYRIYHTSPCKIIEIEVTEEQYNKARIIIDRFKNNAQISKYNYIGLLYSLINKETFNNRFLCSEFVYYVLKESGIVDFNKPKNLVRPMNFLDIPNNEIFRGEISHIDQNYSSYYASKG